MLLFPVITTGRTSVVLDYCSNMQAVNRVVEIQRFPSEMMVVSVESLQGT